VSSNEAPPAGAAPFQRPGRSWIWVLLSLGALATGMGAVAYRNYARSESYLAASYERMRLRGAGLDVEGCVDETLAWTRDCEAMKSLCDASMPHVLQICLGAAERTAYCAAVRTRSSDTRFGFAECKARALDRNETKSCGICYRSIDAYCKHSTEVAQP